jgi:hypothetical protein
LAGAAAGAAAVLVVAAPCANTDEPTLKIPNAKASEMMFFIYVKLQNEPMLPHYSNKCEHAVWHCECSVSDVNAPLVPLLH